MTSRAVAATVVDEDPRIYEQKNVHAVYDEIAPHFSSTRYKVGPDIAVSLVAAALILAMAHCRSIHGESAHGLGRLGLGHREWKIFVLASG